MIHQEQTLVERTAVTLDLLLAHAEGRRELPHQPRLLRHGDLPDAEEAQHVVDTVGIEILRHLPETAHPPGAAVSQHLVPVVGGETPVLSVGREVIRRRTSLTVQVEVLRLHPSLHTVTADADGDVALQDHPLFTGMGMGSTHLLVEVELHEIPEGHLLIDLGGGFRHCLALALRQFVMVGPVLEGGSAVEVAVVAEGSVGHQPGLVLVEELLEGLALHDVFAFLGIECPQILQLRIVHPLIVDLGQGIQLLSQCLELRLQGLVLQGRQLTEVRVLGMKGIDADGVIWIGVLPGVGHVRIVDRQYLQHPLFGLGTPVNHHLQVAEVTHAETPLTAQ